MQKNQKKARYSIDKSYFYWAGSFRLLAKHLKHALQKTAFWFRAKVKQAPLQILIASLILHHSRFISMKTFFYLAAALGLSATVQAQTFVSTSPSNKTVVLEEFTGIYCTFCPDGHRIANDIRASYAGSVIINVHTGSFATPSAGDPDFRTPYGDAMRTQFGVSSYPAGTVNRRAFNGNLVDGRGTWAGRANTVQGEASPVNVAVQTDINVSTREVTVDVEVYYTADAPGTTNKLHVLMLQNNISGPQTGMARYPAAILPDGSYNHQHALRHAFTSNAGDDITATTTGHFQAFRYTYTLPASIVNVPTSVPDMEFVAYVSENNENVLSGAVGVVGILSNTPDDASLLSAASAESFGVACGTNATVDLNVMNAGSNTMTSVEVEYSLNGGAAQTMSYSFPTALQTGAIGTVPIAISGLDPMMASNSIEFNVTQINGLTNPSAAASETVAVAIAEEFTYNTGETLDFLLRFDQYAQETGWTIRNETTGAVEASGSGYTQAANPDGSTISASVQIVPGNCYSVEVTDAANDGIWSAQYGLGAFYVTVGGTTVFADSTFAAAASKKFTFAAPTSVEQQQVAESLKLFPNPASQVLNLELSLAEALDVELYIYNNLGQVVYQAQKGAQVAGMHNYQLNTSNLVPGVYSLTLRSGAKLQTERFIIMR